ncbi:plasmid recombination protein [Paracoccus sp. (in: a-proteobacteria)]|uniref:plasmid recombination protein n=1 Tax=Paracoccus sp. TaxID=267 RepID=UPI0026E03818|nr:plasmid recombination protein [Paracoccus sp. (in: a-proteobacteria)]MDO5648120.1 plasmid recombination protein [Paracoccus sp. (in: a-proteobacteria)]
MEQSSHPAPPASKANPRAISTRIKSKARVQTNGQRQHDLRIGRQPKYVDHDRSQLNRVIVAPLSGGEMRRICDDRRNESGRIRQRRVSDSAAVSTVGIITFGHEAQHWVEAMPAADQNALFLGVATAVADRLGTSLHGLVVHLDESAIHAHYQMAAVTRDGRPVSKVATKSVLNALQDLAAEVGRKYEPRIERGHRKRDRLAAGAKLADTINRSVRQLHEDLPEELAELLNRIEAARTRLQKNLRLADRLRVAAEKKGEHLDASHKTLARYLSRADQAKSELEKLEAEMRAGQAALKKATRARFRAHTIEAAAKARSREAEMRLADLQRQEAAAASRLEKLEEQEVASARRLREVDEKAQQATALIQEARALRRSLAPLRAAAEVWQRHMEQVEAQIPDFLDAARRWVYGQGGNSGPNPRLERLQEYAGEFLGDPAWRAAAGKAIHTRLYSTARALWTQLTGMDNRAARALTAWRQERNLRGDRPNGSQDLIAAVATELSEEAAVRPKQIDIIMSMPAEERQKLQDAVHHLSKMP